MAIGAFPDFYPDEIFYGAMSRCAESMHFPNLRAVTEEVFGSQQVIATLYFPSHLDALIVRLPPNSAYTSDMLINQHTLLPFFAPFLPLQRVVKLRQDMKGAGGPAGHMRAGTMASIVPLTTVLRYCPECVKRDRAQLGECYWHRLHQVPGVQVCPLHDLWLEPSEVAVRHHPRRMAYISAEEALTSPPPARPVPTTSVGEVLRFVATSAAWLLEQANLSAGPDVLYQRYQRALIKRDLASYHGRVKMSVLLEAFCAAYPPPVLNLLGCPLDTKIQGHWLARLVRKPQKALNPLQHMLLIHFLGYKVEEFFQQPTEKRPFGSGPWPCLNGASSHYWQLMIPTCEITYPLGMLGQPTGIFSCACGFVYARSGPDNASEDQWRRGRVIRWGELWEDALRTKWSDATLSVNRIAQHLDVDPLTVKRQAVRLGLALTRQHEGDEIHLTLAKPLCTIPLDRSTTGGNRSYRAAWLALREQHPTSGTKALRALLPHLYAWLYRHDQAWLEDHLPPGERVLRCPRVDWAERDKELAAKIQVVASSLKHVDNYPIRITTAVIGRAIGQLALLQQHLDRLPLTGQVLTAVVETREAFALRRLRRAVNAYQLESRCPTRWELIRRAGLERVATWPSVQQSVQASLRALQLGLEQARGVLVP